MSTSQKVTNIVSENKEDEEVGLQLICESVLCHYPGMSYIKELYKHLPPPETPLLKQMLTLRCLEHSLNHSGLDSKILRLLYALKSLCTYKTPCPKGRSFEEFGLCEPPSQLSLYVAREIAVKHMRQDDWPEYDETFRNHWREPGFLEIGEEQEEEGSNLSTAKEARCLEEVLETRKDLMAVHENFSLAKEISKKYPEEAVMDLLENYLCKAWEKIQNLFSAKSMEFYRPKARSKSDRNRNEEATETGKGANTSLLLRCTNNNGPKGICLDNGEKGDSDHLEDREVSEELPKPGTFAELRILGASLDMVEERDAPAVIPLPPWRDIPKAGKVIEDEIHTQPLTAETETEGGNVIPDEIHTQPITAESEIQPGAQDCLGVEEEMDDLLSLLQNPRKKKKLPSQSEATTETDPQAEVGVALDELRKSSAQLKKLGTDPLEESLAMAGKVAEVQNDKAGQLPFEVASLERREKRKALPEEDVIAFPVAELIPFRHTGGENSPSEAVARSGGDFGRIGGSSYQRRTRSLLERQETARQQAWESDGEAEISDPDYTPVNRPHLEPVVVDRTFSPLKSRLVKKNGSARGNNLVPQRRYNTPWSEEETNALVEGVAKYQKKWKLILMAHSDLFVGRTTVDLKDKWRNIEKYGRKLPQK